MTIKAMRTFVIGDIHGAHKALLQCFERSNFDYDNDRLIALGDVCDGWPEVRQSIDELLKIKNLIYIVGNHDLWTLNWALNGTREKDWLDQGGLNTLKSYGDGPMPESHKNFLNNARWFWEEDKRLFVHAGFDPALTMEKQDKDVLVWDRELVKFAYQINFMKPEHRVGNYEEVFLGHTTTQVFRTLKPLKLCNIWMLDTGAGWSGPLTIMDVQTKQFWQSDLTPTLYRGISGRKS